MLRSLTIENLVLIRGAQLSFVPGLNVITGETGAGKTILAQAFGLLLGARGDPALVGQNGTEAYVEAEFDLPAMVLEDEAFAGVLELRPEDEDGVVLARRVGAEGRTRAFAWGRGASREDVAALAERLLAMSGQFEQRRLARPAYQLEVLDAFCGDDHLRRRAEARAAWRELAAARRRLEEVAAGSAAAETRIAELQALVEDTEGMRADRETELREQRERLRRFGDLIEATTAAAEALDPEEGLGAAALVAEAERSLAPVEALADELRAVGDELRDTELRLREAGSGLRAFLASLDAEPGRLDAIEEELGRIGEAKRRFRCATYEELLARAAEARTELEALEEGFDPVAAAEEALRAAEERTEALADALRTTRNVQAAPFAEAVAAELRGVGMGDGEFRVELREQELGPTGRDSTSFLIRPNAGLPFAPVADTASGGELSRVALAIAAVAGGETLVFDEIDAGIGGRTALAVAETLARLATRAQVIAITHLPQIASRGDRHLRVEKVPGDPTHTRIDVLSDDERKEEIERMLGGREFLATLQQ